MGPLSNSLPLSVLPTNSCIPTVRSVRIKINNRYTHPPGEETWSSCHCEGVKVYHCTCVLRCGSVWSCVSGALRSRPNRATKTDLLTNIPVSRLLAGGFLQELVVHYFELLMLTCDFSGHHNMFWGKNGELVLPPSCARKQNTSRIRVGATCTPI